MTYEDKVYQLLNNMKPGERIQVDKICKKQPRERFISVVKEYIDIHPNGNGIEFSNDYNTIKKTAWKIF